MIEPVHYLNPTTKQVMYYAIVKWSLEGDNEILDGYDDREDAFEALDNYQDRYPDGYLDVVRIGK